MNFQIEKGVPIPKRYRRENAGITACLKRMAVGDSIVIDNSLKPSIYNLAKRAGFKITTRFESSESTRIWRLI